MLAPPYSSLHRHAEHAEVAEFLPQVHRELVAAIDLGGARGDFGGGEAAPLRAAMRCRRRGRSSGRDRAWICLLEGGRSRRGAPRASPQLTPCAGAFGATMVANHATRDRLPHVFLCAPNAPARGYTDGLRPRDVRGYEMCGRDPTGALAPGTNRASRSARPERASPPRSSRRLTRTRCRSSTTRRSAGSRAACPGAPTACCAAPRSARPNLGVALKRWCRTTGCSPTTSRSRCGRTTAVATLPIDEHRRAGRDARVLPASRACAICTAMPAGRSIRASRCGGELPVRGAAAPRRLPVDVPRPCASAPRRRLQLRRALPGIAAAAATSARCAPCCSVPCRSRCCNTGATACWRSVCASCCAPARPGRPRRRRWRAR